MSAPAVVGTTPKASETSAAVGDYSHPHWCDLGKCDPNTTHGEPPGAYGGLHESAGTGWSVQADEVELKVALTRLNDMLGGRNHGRTFVHLHMLAHNNLTPGYADAWLSPDDVDLLIRFLQEYSERAKNDLRYPAGTYDVPVQEVERHL